MDRAAMLRAFTRATAAVSTPPSVSSLACHRVAPSVAASITAAAPTGLRPLSSVSGTNSSGSGSGVTSIPLNKEWVAVASKEMKGGDPNKLIWNTAEVTTFAVAFASLHQ
jgi:hypothetical protein